MDNETAALADEQADQPTPPQDPAPKPVDTGAQEQAGQDRADGGGYT